MKAIISGSTRGVGKAIAKSLATEEIDLVLIARTKSDLEAQKEELKKYNISIDILPIDLSTPDALSTHHSVLDHSDLLINNLGVYQPTHIAQLVPSEVHKAISVNLYSAIALTNMVLPSMKKKSKGQIINIGSVMGLTAASHAADYSISKHAFKAWNDALREDLRFHGIKVSAIYPGAINTSSWDGIEADRTAMIQPEDIAKQIVSLLKMNTNTLVEEIRISPLNFKLS